MTVIGGSAVQPRQEEKLLAHPAAAAIRLLLNCSINRGLSRRTHEVEARWESFIIKNCREITRPAALTPYLMSGDANEGYNPLPFPSFLSQENVTAGERLHPTWLRLEKGYILWYVNVTRLVVTGIVPFIMLTYLNSRIYTVIRYELLKKPANLSKAINTSVVKV